MSFGSGAENRWNDDRMGQPAEYIIPTPIFAFTEADLDWGYQDAYELHALQVYMYMHHNSYKQIQKMLNCLISFLLQSA